MTWTRLVELLPSIATQPLAIVAYIVLVSGWVLFQFRRRRSLDFLKALESLDEKERSEFCRRAGYAYDELARLSRKDQVRLITGRYVLLAFLATLVAIVLLVLGSRRVIGNADQIQKQLDNVETKQDELLTKVAEIAAIRRELHVQLDAEQSRALAIQVAGLVTGSDHSKLQQDVGRSADTSSIRSFLKMDNSSRGSAAIHSLR